MLLRMHISIKYCEEDTINHIFRIPYLASCHMAFYFVFYFQRKDNRIFFNSEETVDAYERAISNLSDEGPHNYVHFFNEIILIFHF